MKRSTITLISTLGIVLVIVLGTSLSLKGKFDRMDKKDLFHGFLKYSTTEFSYVKLQGPSSPSNRIEILPGDHYGVNTVRDSTYVKWEIRNDTLIVTSKSLYNLGHVFRENPSLYVIAPTLKGVIGHDANFRIRDVATKRLDITVTGGNLLMSGCKIGGLSAMAELRGELYIDEKNTIDTAGIIVGERGRLNVEKNVFKSFQVSVDSTGSAYLPKDLIGAEATKYKNTWAQ